MEAFSPPDRSARPRRLYRLVVWVLLPVVLVAGAVWQARLKAPAPVEDPPTLAALTARASLLPLPAIDQARVPVAYGWSMPMGTDNGAFTYNAQPFGVENAYRGGRHLGDDLNGIGQENTDLDDPVFAGADGLVVYAGHPSDGWGGVVILAHRLPEDGRLVQSFYGHLKPEGIRVVPGQEVARGDLLGRLGLTTAMDYAHLHFEIREGATIRPGPGYAPASLGDLDRLDPTAFLADRLVDPGTPAPAAMRKPPLIKFER